MSAAYLEKLNPDQRRAVEHGMGKSADDAHHALVVIAGAGSGTRPRIEPADDVLRRAVGGEKPAAG